MKPRPRSRPGMRVAFCARKIDRSGWQGGITKEAGGAPFGVQRLTSWTSNLSDRSRSHIYVLSTSSTSAIHKLQEHDPSGIDCSHHGPNGKVFPCYGNFRAQSWNPLSPPMARHVTNKATIAANPSPAIIKKVHTTTGKSSNKEEPQYVKGPMVQIMAIPAGMAKMTASPGASRITP